MKDETFQEVARRMDRRRTGVWITLILIVVMIIAIGRLSADDKAKPTTVAEITLQPDTLQGMQQVYREAIMANDAYVEAKRLITGKDDCDVRTLRILESNNAAKQNAWVATETNARYLSNVPKEFILDMGKGVYRAKTVSENAQGGNK